MNSELQSALAAVQALQPPQPPLEAPAHLRGLLAGAAARGDDSAPGVRSIVFRAPEASRALRSSPAFLADFCGEVQGSRGDAEFGGAVTALRERLLATGAYRGVGAALEPCAPGAAPNLVITLDELSYSANAGAMGGVRGSAVTAGVSLSAINALGYAESLSLSMGNDVPMAYGVGGSDGASALGSLLSGGAQGAGALAHLPFGSAAPAPAARLALPRAPQPNWKLEARKPTLAGTAASLGLMLRQDTAPLEAHSSLTHKLLEGEASFTDATGRHSLALATALRQLSPLRPAHSPTATLSSPETLSHCLASVKNSFTYAARLGPGLAPSDAVPASGARAAARVEVAGLGGDISFLKLAASGTWAASLGRYTPDTGYQLPSGSGGERGLQPFPGAAGLLPWCRSSSGPRPALRGGLVPAGPAPREQRPHLVVVVRAHDRLDGDRARHGGLLAQEGAPDAEGEPGRLPEGQQGGRARAALGEEAGEGAQVLHFARVHRLHALAHGFGGGNGR